MSDCESVIEDVVDDKNTKKRKKCGRISDTTRYLRNHCYTQGDPCKCKRFDCFNTIPKVNQNQILNNFNSMKDRNEQNQYLAGLITVLPIKKRRPRRSENEAILRDAAYSFRVKVLQETTDTTLDIQVCYKAFLSLHGITARRVQTIKKQLLKFGVVKPDNRGKHTTRPHLKTRATKQAVHDFIASLRGRKAHYSLTKTTKTYLPEELNIKKTYKMYTERNPNHPVSYEYYRNYFNCNFNISFGYPPTDTCSQCDKFLIEEKTLCAKINDERNEERKTVLMKQKELLQKKNILHKLKAATFYNRKRQAKSKAKTDLSYEGITIDFAKNLPVPNITTNDVYYRRQLSVYSFNIHILSGGQSIFFSYPQIIAHKGADDVVSMLNYFIWNILPTDCRKLAIFCDSCAGQNKNFTMIRYLHYIVHNKKRFDEVTVTFPERGHSYLECDKDFGLINQKTFSELPEDWARIFRESRVKPCPFHVIEAKQEIFHKWTSFLSTLYKKQCPFATRPVSELSIKSSDNCQIVKSRQTFNGLWESYVIVDQRAKRRIQETDGPEMSYNELIPIKKALYSDLQHLKQFCSQKAQDYFTNLPQLH